MPISTLNDYIASSKQRLNMTRTASRTAIANTWYSIFDLAGQPGAGVLAGGQTTPPANTAGAVPTDAIAGYPLINDWTTQRGYISKIEFASSVACRIALFDRLWVGGTYAFNANVAVTSPSWASRVSYGGGAANYNGLEIWVEQVTAATGNQAVNVTYTAQGGATGKTTGATGVGAAPAVGRCWQLPLATGDTGVQAISNVAGSTATAGTFNVMVLRRLWSGRINAANIADVHDMLRTGLPEIFTNSALYALIQPDSTATGLPDLSIEVASN
jgi:hypothetical protein